MDALPEVEESGYEEADCEDDGCDFGGRVEVYASFDCERSVSFWTVRWKMSPCRTWFPIVCHVALYMWRGVVDL